MPAANTLATRCKPTLGYATKGAAIIALHDERKLSFGQIALKLGTSERDVSSLYTKTKQRAARATRTVSLPVNVFYDLESEARRRGVDPYEMAVSILQIVAENKLFAAVLDG